MELADYLRMLRRGWPTVLLLLVICVGGVVGYLKTTAKVYTASSTIVVLPNDPKTFSDLANGSQFTVDRASTYAQIIESPQVLTRAAQQLGKAQTAQKLESQVSATARTATSIIDISATDNSAGSAEAIANAVADSAQALIPTVAFGGPMPDTTLVTVEVLKPANASTVSVSPSTSRILGIGVALGLVLGLVITIARQSLDTRLRLPRDVQNLMLAPLRGVVPRPERRMRFGIAVRDDPSGPAGDSYRSLRTNLSDISGRGRRSLIFAAVSDGVSAAQVSLNFAWSFAQAGRRVLFMDLDMRQSPVDTLLGVHEDLGMADVLAGSARLQDVVRATEQDKLSVVSAGVASSNPADLLSSAEMVRVLNEAKALFESVVVHVPPLLLYTDGALVAMAADQTFLTISAGETRVAELTEAMEILVNTRTKPVGLVLYGARRRFRRGQRRLRFEASEGASSAVNQSGPAASPDVSPDVSAPAEPPRGSDAQVEQDAPVESAPRATSTAVATDMSIFARSADAQTFVWLKPKQGSSGEPPW